VVLEIITAPERDQLIWSEWIFSKIFLKIVLSKSNMKSFIFLENISEQFPK